MESKCKSRSPEVSCYLCKKVCSKGTIKHHIEVAHKNRRFKCNHCQKLVTGLQTLRSHISTQHNGKHFDDYEVVYLDAAPKKKSSLGPKKACEICKKWYPNHTFNRHIEDVHHKKRFNCLHCQKLFIGKGSIQIHLSLQHNGANHKKDFEVVYLKNSSQTSVQTPKPDTKERKATKTASIEVTSSPPTDKKVRKTERNNFMNRQQSSPSKPQHSGSKATPMRTPVKMPSLEEAAKFGRKKHAKHTCEICNKV
jgi:hypothetical protein